MRLVLRKAKVFEPLAQINRGDVLIEIDWFHWNAKLNECQRAVCNHSIDVTDVTIHGLQ